MNGGDSFRSAGTPGRHRIVRLVMLLLLLPVSAVALAKPAPWYLWQSRTDNHYLCIQTTPGPGWQRVSGPYSRAQCNKFLKELMIDPRPFSRSGKKSP